MPSSSLAISAAVAGLAFLALAAAETARPLRRRVESRLRRTARNVTMGGLSLALITLLQAPIIAPVAAWTSRRGWGVLRLAELPPAAALLLGILLMDYTLWHWHRINHRVPFFWRFHLVHHVDRDMDASTALRFHFGEIAFSVGWRVLQIAAIGPSPLAIWIYQLLLFVSILFHHSNTRLPLSLERVLVRWVVTPRMHGIHHSDWRNETDSNWSSLLSVWDYLHGTAVLSVPQSEIEIGVPAYLRAEDVTLPKILLNPFGGQRDDWRAVDRKPRIERPAAAHDARELAP
ncbi:MAG: sterol desaturase family protein [Acidobacteria bacterium]|nr:sterol desaturase family protein [Acidobacteriota bacterium]MCA1610099.1 sterol desaturase family protein [Acidobacteriota bacterium]